MCVCACACMPVGISYNNCCIDVCICDSLLHGNVHGFEDSVHVHVYTLYVVLCSVCIPEWGIVSLKGDFWEIVHMIIPFM